MSVNHRAGVTLFLRIRKIFLAHQIFVNWIPDAYMDYAEYSMSGLWNSGCDLEFLFNIFFCPFQFVLMDLFIDVIF